MLYYLYINIINICNHGRLSCLPKCKTIWSFYECYE